MPVHSSVAGGYVGDGGIHRDGGVIQVGACWEPLVPEEVPIVEPVNAPCLWGPMVPPPYINKY